MATQLTNFVVDHAIRLMMVSKSTGEFMWSINQISDPSLSVAVSDTRTITDALGGTIMELENGKSAELSGNSSLFDLHLYAAQMGREVEKATSTDKISVPAFEEITYDGTTTSYTLANTPNSAVTRIYLENGDGSLGTTFTAGTAASATEFVYDGETGSITVPTGLTKDDVLFVMYDYDSSGASVVTADAINFPKAGRAVMEVLGYDPCDEETQIHAYIDFANAKLSSEVDWDIASDGNHPFTIQAYQSYCDKEKKLFRIIVPDEE